MEFYYFHRNFLLMEISLSDNQLKQLIETTIFMACEFSPKSQLPATNQEEKSQDASEGEYEFVDLFIWPFEQQE